MPRQLVRVIGGWCRFPPAAHYASVTSPAKKPLHRSPSTFTIAGLRQLLVGEMLVRARHECGDHRVHVPPCHLVTRRDPPAHRSPPSPSSEGALKSLCDDTSILPNERSKNAEQNDCGHDDACQTHESGFPSQRSPSCLRRRNAGRIAGSVHLGPPCAAATWTRRRACGSAIAVPGGRVSFGRDMREPLEHSCTPRVTLFAPRGNPAPALPCPGASVGD